MVDGKLNIWIKKGKFSFSNDLYVKVLCDEKQIGKTDEKDSTRPEWDQYVTPPFPFFGLRDLTCGNACAARW